jgi:signal transduction histidine kinase
LPLAVAFILAVVLAAMALAASVEVRSSALALASDRLTQATQQIVGVIDAPIARSIALLKTETSHPDTVAAVADPGDHTRDAWIAHVMSTRTGNAGRSTSTTELWDASRHRVASAGPDLPPVPDADAAALCARAEQDGFVISPFTMIDAAVMQTTVGPVVSDGRVAGYLVSRSALASSAQQLLFLRNLIYPNSRLLVANAAGDIWTDFSKRVDGPPAASNVLHAGTLVSYTGADKLPVFGRAMRVAQTPWMVVLEFPQGPILAPVRRFIWRAVLLSSLLAIGGAVVGWRLSRRVTRPLKRMTEAAVAIAAGQSSDRISLGRSDELGQLAGAFDTMVASLKESEDKLRAMNAELEERVRARTMELEDANRELEAFTSSISHDLRAPLRAISGFSRIVVETHGADLPPDVGVHMRTINRNVKRMDQLIDDLLTFSRLSRQPMVRGATDMSALARGAIREVERAHTGRSIHFVLNPLPPANAERSLVRHVMDNLVQNAAKFTSTRQHAQIEIGHTGDGDDAAYYVRDNGVGFDMQYADGLFGVFRRLHKPGEFDGTGVGLAVVHRIVSRHGGRVWAQAELDRGATFYFTLPRDTSS